MCTQWTDFNEICRMYSSCERLALLNRFSRSGQRSRSLSQRGQENLNNAMPLQAYSVDGFQWSLPCHRYSHGRRSRGDRRTSTPRIWSRERWQIVPLRFRHIGTKMSVLWPSKYAKIRFRRPGHCWGRLRRSPRPPSLLGANTPPHIPPHSAPTYLRRSPCVPPEVQPDLRLWMFIVRVGIAEMFPRSEVEGQMHLLAEAHRSTVWCRKPSCHACMLVYRLWK